MRLRTLLCTAAAVAAAACGESTEPPVPTPGALTVTLQAPSGVTTGAVVLTLAGPGAITNVTAVGGGLQVYSRPAAGGVSVAAFGTIPAGALLRFDVPDTRAADEYSATLVEAAGTDNTVKSLTGYGVTVSD